MKKVYCIGELLIDLVSEDGENYIKKAGGAPANVAVAINKLGGESYFLGQVGNDSFGNYLESVLKENSVNSNFLKKEGKTTVAIVTIDKSGERSFDFYRGGDGEYEVQLETLNLDSNSIVHFGSATAFLPGKLKESYYKLLENAKAKGAMVTFDPNYRELLITEDLIESYKKSSLEFMKVADFIKLSDEEAMLLTGENTLELAIEKLTLERLKTIAITLGKKGTMVIKDGKSFIIDSIKINQKDSTGAGDAFVGAVLYKLSIIEGLKSIDYEEIIAFANVVGAITCENYGAISSIPTMDNVKQRIK